MLSDRFAAGELSLDQVDAISKMTTMETESGLIEEAMGLTNSALDLRARRARGISEDDTRTAHDRRRLWRQWNLDESELKFGGNLDAEAGRLFDDAIDSRVEGMGTNPDTGMFDPMQTRAVDALTEIVAGEGGESQLTVFADKNSLIEETGSAELDNTAQVPNELARRLGCDGAVRTIITDGAQPIGVGRRTRKIPDWLKEPVYYRDGGRCRFPGCRHTRWIQIHHIQHGADGGRTDLDNLTLLCGAHHRFIHARGWHITVRHGKFEFRKQDWTVFPSPRSELEPRLQDLVRSP